MSIVSSLKSWPSLEATASHLNSVSIAALFDQDAQRFSRYSLEAAGLFGPVFFQSGVANASFGQPTGADLDVQTFYLQGSVLLNGGRKVYKAGNGVFGSPKVTDRGLWELTARYDHIENQDVPGLEASALILGMNYYVNSNLRVMFNYTQGDNDFSGDETGQFALRTQFNF